MVSHSLSKGDLRDSLKLLDQLSLIGSGEIYLNWVWELSGTIPEHDLLAMTENIAYSEVTENLSILQGWLESGKQPSVIHEALVSFLKALLVCKVNPTATGKKLTQLEDDTLHELVAITQSLRTAQIQSAIALLMSRQNLMRDEAAALWLEATIIELTPVKPENSQPWKDWKSPKDAIAWGKSNLPHLSQSEVERHWNQLEPVNGKKAGAWDPKTGVFILTSTQQRNLLPTISSRCQVVNFIGLSDSEVLSVLEKEGFNLNDQALLAISLGSPGQAITNQNMLETIPGWIIEELESPPDDILSAIKLSNHVSAWDYSVQVWFLKYLQYKWWGRFRSVGQLDKFTIARKRFSSNVNPKNICDALLLP
jgi:DNA polymerase III gamma/tau subunit